MVKVYTKEKCPQCLFTKKKLDSLGVEYVTLDVEKSAEAMAELKEMGFSALPVVVTPEKTWTGFKPELLSKIV